MKMSELHAEVADLESEKDFQLRLKLEGILQMLSDARIENICGDWDERSGHTTFSEDMTNAIHDSQDLLAKAIEQLKPLAGY